ncbi:YjgN family protein [Deinococcus yavapaiensis]|uniref:Uncharacterized membrane protein YjgN (DUF898 family) n=1 Tax=Deinococcus yavapaiensis KR-236 TaxID=694435 RepID=A0A318SPJ7_9DEIO|nr:YjgN family protein [Deinococcus yavapaiensis]PYE54753.1 uncharacterized membrane protein YjgN (DUF898 family) [Deinococcus yavapaiensis KR-236]
MSSPAFEERVVGRVRPVGAEHPLSFTGSASEYFRIWIVNIALTTITLGLYWAWAKVRTRRYFYGNTWLGGHNFEYTANPVAILRGHIVVAVMAGLYSFLQSYDVALWLVVLALFALVWPYLAWSSLRFLGINTAYRGLRFGFHGQLKDAYKVYLAWPLLLVPTFGLLTPHVTFLQRRYTFDHAAYGSARASFVGKSSEVWTIYLLAFALSVGAFTALGIAAFVLVVAAGLLGALGGDLGASRDSSFALFGVLALVPIYALYLLALAALGAFVKASLLHYSLTNTRGRLDDGSEVAFESTISPWMYTGISVVNTLAQVVTLGLATPWAAVRRANYVLPRVAVVSPRPLDEFTSDVAQRQNALGEAATDFLGLDIAL